VEDPNYLWMSPVDPWKDLFDAARRNLPVSAPRQISIISLATDSVGGTLLHERKEDEVERVRLDVHGALGWRHCY
jgi:hypothetical protein